MVHKIGIDYHGVITHQPSFWKFMLGCVMGSGGEVHIITGGTLLGDENPIINQESINSVQNFGIKHEKALILFNDGMESRKKLAERLRRKPVQSLEKP